MLMESNGFTNILACIIHGSKYFSSAYTINYPLLKRLTFLPAGREDGYSHWTFQNSLHHDHHVRPCVFFSSIHTIFNINFMEKYFNKGHQK